MAKRVWGQFGGGSVTAKVNGQKLRKLRLALPNLMLQKRLEEQLGIKHGQLTRFENSFNGSIADLIKLAAFFGVNPKELIDNEGLRATKPLLINLALIHDVEIVWPKKNCEVPPEETEVQVQSIAGIPAEVTA